MNKKTYIAPQINVIMMSTTSIMAGSPTSGGSLSGDGNSGDLGGKPEEGNAGTGGRVAAYHFVPWSDDEDCEF